MLRWQDNHRVTLNLPVKFKYSELHVALATARLHLLNELAAWFGCAQQPTYAAGSRFTRIIRHAHLLCTWSGA
jgi:hypothetical protein